MSFIKNLQHFILSLIFITAACQNKQKEDNMPNHLRIDFQEGDLTSLHPHDLMIYLRGISIGKTLFEGLTRIDEQGKPVLAGAKSVDVSPSGLCYTFKLRENRWSDGTPVTAFQYEAAWKEALAPVSLCPRPDLLYMLKNAAAVKKGEAPIGELGVKAVDAGTLFVELGRPSPYFLELLAQPIAAPLQKPAERTMKAFNGPFQLDKWERSASLTLKPNPYFWNQKQVSLERIEVSIVQDPQTAFSLYEQKQFDWIGVPLCALSVEQIRYLEEKKELLSKPMDRSFWLFLNTQHGPLSSPSIRKALSLAIDRDVIVRNLLIGNKPLQKPLPLSLLPIQAKNPLKTNIAEAKRLFTAGLKELGLTQESFPPLVITYSPQAGRKQLAEYFQDAWTRALGVQVQLEPQEWNVLRTNLSNGDFKISGCFEASFYHDPMELLDRMAHLDTRNFPKWESALYQQKVGMANDELNLDNRMKLLSEAEEILIDQMPFIPISSDKFLFAHNPKLRGYRFDCVGSVDFSYASLK